MSRSEIEKAAEMEKSKAVRPDETPVLTKTGPDRYEATCELPRIYNRKCFDAIGDMSHFTFYR